MFSYTYLGHVAECVTMLLLNEEEKYMDKYVTCQCCGKEYRTHSFGTDMYTVCPNCSWEQDPFIEDNKSLSYANGMCVTEARQNIINHGNIFGYKLKFYQHKFKLYLDGY